MRRLVPLLAVAALLALALGPLPAAGGHPPVPLCGGCTGGFEDAAADHGVVTTVTHSELELHVDGNATTTGVARIDVDEGAASQFQRNQRHLQTVAEDAFVTPERSKRSHWAHEAVIRDVTAVNATIEGQTITVRFTIPDEASHGVGGVVYTDLFDRRSTAGGIAVHVDTATITGPDGASVVLAPQRWDGDAIRFHGDDADPAFVGHGGYVAWAPTAGFGAQVAATTSIWIAEASTEYPQIAASSWLAVVVALGMGALATIADPGAAPGDGRWASTKPAWGAVAYGLGVCAAVAGAFAAFAWLHVGWLGVALLALAPGLLGAALLLGGCAILDVDPGDAFDAVPTVGYYVLLGVTVLSLVAAVLAPVVVALGVAMASVLLVGALGAATTRGSGPTGAVVVTLALAPVALGFPGLAGDPLGSPASVVWITFVVLTGIPLYALGRRAGTAPPRPRSAPAQD